MPPMISITMPAKPIQPAIDAFVLISTSRYGAAHRVAVV